MAVTIKDVAQVAGVSRGTVDRVLHNRPNVHPIARKRVLEAMKKTGYKMPTEFKENDTNVKKVVIIIPPWSDSYFNRQISRGICQAEKFINDSSFEVVQHDLGTDSPQELITVMDMYAKRGFHGMIIRPENTQNMILKVNDLIDKGIAVVTYDGDLPSSQRLCHFGQDLQKSGGIAAGIMAKLIEGDKHILIITGNMLIETHKGRVNGFCTRLEELGFPSSSYKIVECFEHFELTSQFVEEALKKDSKIAGIYMATQSVTGCIDGVKRAKPKKYPKIIVNDLTPSAKKYLSQGMIDFVIDQTYYHKSFKSLVALYQILMKNRRPEQDVYFTNLSIVSREML